MVAATVTFVEKVNIQMISAESKIDIAAFVPPKRRIVRDIVIIALLSLVCGPMLGLLLLNAPRGVTLSLSLATGLVWGLAFAFVMAFIYTAWLIYHVTSAYNKHVAALKMDDFYRAIGDE
jgi:mannose/fructose/N-acetylgalactosamine-specific phosphotransferase system component IIC